MFTCSYHGFFIDASCFFVVFFVWFFVVVFCCCCFLGGGGGGEQECFFPPSPVDRMELSCACSTGFHSLPILYMGKHAHLLHILYCIAECPHVLQSSMITLEYVLIATIKQEFPISLVWYEEACS